MDRWAVHRFGYGDHRTQASISAYCEEQRFEARWQVSTQHRRPPRTSGLAPLFPG